VARQIVLGLACTAIAACVGCGTLPDTASFLNGSVSGRVDGGAQVEASPIQRMDFNAVENRIIVRSREAKQAAVAPTFWPPY
jgi:hypothetical protein